MTSSAPTGRHLWERPALRRDEDFEQDRSVTPLELFFDLVFVVVISRLAHHLAEHNEPGEVLRFAVQFLAVFWVWNGFTYYAERFESDGLENRLLTFLSMLPVAGMAVYAEDGLGEAYTGFAVAYLLARGVNQLGWAWAGHHVRAFRPVSARLNAAFLLAVALIVASTTVDGWWRTSLFALAVLAEIAAPWFTVLQQSALPKLSTSKYPERFGLFTIIVLGESVVGVIIAISDVREEGGLAAGQLVAAALGLAIGFSLWWIYFDFVARRPPKPVFLTALVWVYLHLAGLTAVTATGVGVSLVIVDSGGPALLDSSRYLLVGSVAVGLVAVAALQTTLARGADEPTHPRLSPALKVAVAAVVAVLGGLGLGWSSTGLLLFVLLALAVPMAYGTYVWFVRPYDPGARGSRPDEPAARTA